MKLATGVQRLQVRNFRALRDVVLDDLEQVTAFIGPNGSGKSTLFDVIMFVNEALGGGLEAAWRRRGGLAQIRTRGADGPVEIELACRTVDGLFTYRLALEENEGMPVVAEERLVWQERADDSGLAVLEFHHRRGIIRRPGSKPEKTELVEDGILGVGTFGQLAPNAEIAAFLRFVMRIQLIDLDVRAMRAGASGPARGTGLDPHGGNIAMRVRHLQEREPEDWAELLRSLRRFVPYLEDIQPVQEGDTHIVLLREEGRAAPVRPASISDGTLLLLGYLVALRSPLAVLLVEEPETRVHPRLHYLLAEEARGTASEQVFISTHAPQFVDALRLDELWLFGRVGEGVTEVKRASEVEIAARMIDHGGSPGNLWTEGYFRFGDPLADRT
ncbi:AAA family ATPase [Amycolatopsis sp. NBC_00345]|uniref:AAA family ATPase n=1 Tax=Amycolatopsis sp. NBC_00345 TaxID=2975955 RepID=UPI002E2524BA